MHITPRRADNEFAPCLPALPTVSGIRRIPMPNDFQFIAVCFAFLAVIAMFVKNERRMRRWLMRGGRRRRKTARFPVLQ